MNQATFWGSFKHDPAVRQAHIYHALHFGPDPAVWGKTAATPTFYNELAFLATLEVFDRHPTRKAAMQMGVFIFKRGSGAGEMWVVDPANATSQARKMAGIMVGKAKDDYRTKNPVQGYAVGGGAMKIASAAKAPYLKNTFDRVRQELCKADGVLNQYLANIGTLMGARGGDVGHDILLAARYKRLEGIKKVPGKASWLNDLVSKFEGQGFASSKIGQTFDATQIGLTGGERYAHMAFPRGD